jgi:tryptophan-rich sensory protein
MGIAAYLVWRRGTGDVRVKSALIVFVVQLVLNAAWSPAFFGLRSTLAGLVVILPLWFAISATIVLFWRVSKAGGLLLVPYIAWVTYAAALNISFWYLNR